MQLAAQNFAPLHHSAIAWQRPAVESRILLVDSQEASRRQTRAMLGPAGTFEFAEAPDGFTALRVLREMPVDLVVADIAIPGTGGPELFRRIKSDPATRLLPILVLTSVAGREYEVLGIESGADEYLTKPVEPSVLQARVRALLRNKAAVDSLDHAESILFALAQAVEARDPYTAGHCERLAAYGVAMGAALGLSRPELVALYRGGYLHDIGKISVPDSILHGQRQLTEAEWEIMKRHTVQGEEICRPMKSLAAVLPIIRGHHERWDGTGYPDGLAGGQIPLLARILQVVDIFDALITARPYKPAFSVEKALSILSDEAAKGWRDPDLVRLFVDMAGRRVFESDGTARSLQNLQNQIEAAAAH